MVLFLKGEHLFLVFKRNNMKKLNNWILNNQKNVIYLLLLIQILLLAIILLSNSDNDHKLFWLKSGVILFFAGFCSFIFYPFYFFYSKILDNKVFKKSIEGLFLIEFYFYFIGIISFFYNILFDKREPMMFSFIPGFMIMLVVFEKLTSLIRNKFYKK